MLLRLWKMKKAYLGDSVYVEVNEHNQLVLTTENGLSTDPSNEIFLEPEVYHALVNYVEQLKATTKDEGSKSSS